MSKNRKLSISDAKAILAEYLKNNSEIEKARDDRSIYGHGFIKDGKRIDPKDVLEEPKREEKARE